MEEKKFYIDFTGMPESVKKAWFEELDKAGAKWYESLSDSLSFHNAYGLKPVLLRCVGEKLQATIEESGKQFTPEQAIDYFKGPKEEKEIKADDWVIMFKHGQHNDKTNRHFPINKVWRVCHVDSDTNHIALEHGYGTELDCFRLATKEEIQSHLIAEGLRNGVLKAGTSIKTLCGLSVTWTTDCHIFHYDLVTDTLLAHGAEVYSKGKWAEIVEQGIEINKYEKAISDIEKILEAIK